MEDLDLGFVALLVDDSCHGEQAEPAFCRFGAKFKIDTDGFLIKSKNWALKPGITNKTDYFLIGIVHFLSKYSVGMK